MAIFDYLVFLRGSPWLRHQCELRPQPKFVTEGLDESKYVKQTNLGCGRSSLVFLMMMRRLSLKLFVANIHNKRGRRMETFLQRFADKIKGVITGFDRIVFKGCIRPLMFADGAMSFLRSRGVLNKDYKDWMVQQSAVMVEAAERYARSNTGEGITPYVLS
jgi:hypothetical protein